MIGAEAYLHMNTGKNLITARVPSEVPVTVKESITLYADMEKAQIFDPFTEENILSLPVEKEKVEGLGSKLTQLSIAPLLGEAILRIFHDASVSSLFDK